MHVLSSLITMGMAAFMDFGIGVFITSLVATIVGKALEPWQLIIGGMLAFLPDADLVYYLLTGQKHKIPQHHTTLLHRPLIVVPVASTVAWLYFGSFWGVVTILCVTYHYTHDTKGLLGGAGLQWFWPLSEKEWSFSGSEAPSQHLNPELDSWLSNQWLRPTRQSLLEIGLGSLALGTGTALAYSVCTGSILAAFFLIGAFGVWYVHAES